MYKFISNYIFKSIITFLFLNSIILSCSKQNNYSSNNINEKEKINKTSNILENIQKNIDSNNTLIFEKEFELSFYSYLLDNPFHNSQEISRLVTNLNQNAITLDDKERFKILNNIMKLMPERQIIDINNKYNKFYDEVLNQFQIYHDKIAPTIPKDIHFIWLGGPLGDVQKKYIRIWAELNTDYKINIWYDSDNIYANELKKRMKSYVDTIMLPFQMKEDYSEKYKNKFIEIQNSMFSAITENLKKTPENFSFDAEKLKFIEEKLFKNYNYSIENINKNKEKMLKDSNELQSEFKNIIFNNINDIKSDWKLSNAYEQEMLLRGNFAAASDSARLEILAKFGGIYMDVDLLPSLKFINELTDDPNNKIYFNRIREINKKLSLAILEEFFKANQKFSPQTVFNFNRKNELYKDLDNYLNNNSLSDSLVNKIKNKFNDISNYNKLDDIFLKLGEIKIQNGQLRVQGASNNAIISHKISTNNDWLFWVRDLVFDNYYKLNSEKKNNPNLYYNYDKDYNLANKLVDSEARTRDNAIDLYRWDGLVPDIKATVSLSGPGVFTRIAQEKLKLVLQHEYTYNVFRLKEINKYYNIMTEEELDCSWAKSSKTSNINESIYHAIIPLDKNDNTMNASTIILNKNNNKLTSVLQIDNLYINSQKGVYFEKINLTLVGKIEKNDDLTIKFSNLSADELAIKIKEFKEKNDKSIIPYIDDHTNGINYIELVSLNSINIEDINIYSKNLFAKLDEFGIKTNVISFLKFSQSENKIQELESVFVIKNELNEFLTLHFNNIPEQLKRNHLKKLNNFNSSIKKITDNINGSPNNFSKLISSMQIYQNSLKLEIEKVTSKTKITSKHILNGMKLITNFTTKYNIIMNLINSPQNLANISSLYSNGKIVQGSLALTNFSANNTDFSLDIYKSLRSQSYWNTHKTTYTKITTAQIGLNALSGMIEGWNAYELFKLASNTNDTKIKTDLMVNASLQTAQAATSISTALILPLSAKAGPIGMAIGMTIGFAQGTYNSVRTAEELRALGFAEEEVILKSFNRFFGSYEINTDPEYVKRNYESKIKNDYLNQKLIDSNKNFFSNIFNNNENKNLSYFFNKIIFPEISFYLPFENSEKSTLKNKMTVHTPGKLLVDNIHLCLTHNSYYSKESLNEVVDEFKKIHASTINEKYNLLNIKETIIPKLDNAKNPMPSIKITSYNNTITCKNPYLSSPMHEINYEATDAEINILENIPKSKKANLYLLGFGNQGVHGNMIHSIIAEKNENNYYIVHPATYMMYIEGGNKDDIFEFYDVLTSTEENKGFIDGGYGIDTLNFSGIKKNGITISLKPTIEETSFPIFKNFENVIGTNQNDKIYGNELNNVLIGLDGNDFIYGFDGEDLIIPGRGNDYLTGGKGRDTYLILKKDMVEYKSNSRFYYGAKTIDNSMDIYKKGKEIDYDIIKTDITNLSTKKRENDLVIGFDEYGAFTAIVILKNYFLNEKNQKIYISDLDGNFYMNKNGLLYSEVEEELNNVIITSPNLTFLSEKNNTKDFYGSNLDNAIIGNNKDNYINGNGGFDFISGKDGKDIISIEMTSNKKLTKVDPNKLYADNPHSNKFYTYKTNKILKEKFSVLEGGDKSDKYVLNLSHNDEEGFGVFISNKSLDTDLDNLFINDENNEISNISFRPLPKSTLYNKSKIFAKLFDGTLKKHDNLFMKYNNLHLEDNTSSLGLYFEDKNKKYYSVVLADWYSHNYKFNRHLQIQIGENIIVSEDTLNKLSNSMTNDKDFFNIKIYSNNNFTNIIESTENSISYVLLNKDQLLVNEVVFKFSDRNSNEISNEILKIARFDNEVIFTLENKNDPSKYSSVHFKNVDDDDSNFNNLKIKINNTLFLENDQLLKYIDSLDNGEVIEVVRNE